MISYLFCLCNLVRRVWRRLSWRRVRSCLSAPRSRHTEAEEERHTAHLSPPHQAAVSCKSYCFDLWDSSYFMQTLLLFTFALHRLSSSGYLFLYYCPYACMFGFCYFFISCPLCLVVLIFSTHRTQSLYLLFLCASVRHNILACLDIYYSLTGWHLFLFTLRGSTSFELSCAFKLYGI